MKIKILLLASNPKNTTSLRLAEEFRNIKESIQRSKYREMFEVVQGGAVRSKDFRRLILDESPHIVHFSGHGEKDGIYLENDDGSSRKVEGNALKELFLLFDSIHCVILNSCYSIYQAKSFKNSVPYIISMKWSIEDSKAISFSVGFYDAIGSKRSIEDAFKFGINSIDLTHEESNIRSFDIKNTKKEYHTNPILIKGNIKRDLLFKKSNFYKKINVFFLSLVLMLASVFYYYDIESRKEDAYKKKIIKINKEHFLLREENTRIMTRKEGFIKNKSKVTKLKSKIPKLISSLSEISNKSLPERYLVAKYEMLSELSLMYAGLYARDFQNTAQHNKMNESEKYSTLSISYGYELLSIIKKIKKDYIIKDSKKDRTLYNISTAYGILVSLGKTYYKEKMYLTLNEITEPYKERNPAYNNPFISSYTME